MNSFLKRMFEDEDCSREEAELKAAILGKTYDECKVEWSRQFKKEFILANSNLICQFNYVPDNAGKINFMLTLHYFDISVQPYKNIMKCDNIMLDANSTSQDFRWLVTQYLTISFHAPELDDDFMKALTKKISQQ